MSFITELVSAKMLAYPSSRRAGGQFKQRCSGLTCRVEDPPISDCSTLSSNARAMPKGPVKNELKNRVLDFATDIKQITKDFAVHADPDFRQLVRHALHAALGEAAAACAWHKVSNPL